MRRPIALTSGAARDGATVDALFEQAMAPSGLQMHVDLAVPTVTPAGSAAIRFPIDAERKHRLLNGLDDVSLTLQHADRIRAYEAQRRGAAPWLFD